MGGLAAILGILLYVVAMLLCIGLPLLIVFATIVVSWIISVVLFVVKSIAIFCVAKKEGVKNAWLAWIPVARNLTLGKCSEAVDERKDSKDWAWGKVMLITSIVELALRILHFRRLRTWALYVKTIFTLVCANKIFRGYMSSPFDLLLTLVHAFFGYTFVGVLVVSFFKKKEKKVEVAEIDEFAEAAVIPDDIF